MVTIMNNTEQILKNFIITGNFIKAVPYGSGHINETLLVIFDDFGKQKKYILRKINSFVFKEPLLIIENTINVTNHIKQKLFELNEPDLERKVLLLKQSKNGNYHYKDDQNNYWCLFNFIDRAYTVDHVETENQAFEAAKTYGKFQKYLADFNTSKCHITIKNFHDLSQRLKLFEDTVKNDPLNRVKEIKDEIELTKKFKQLNNNYLDIDLINLPIRITHNDTKINNVMLNENSNEGLCVLDLDTVMPGIILNDFGDMVRTFTSPALEDEKHFSKVKMRLNIFDALVRGYLSELEGLLTENEISNLVLGSKIIVYEQAIRFLTDYIAGDVYYKIEYDFHNLNRARNQFALLESIEAQSEEMEKIVVKYSLKDRTILAG